VNDVRVLNTLYFNSRVVSFTWILFLIYPNIRERVTIFIFNFGQSWKFLYYSLEQQSTQSISYVIQELQFYWFIVINNKSYFFYNVEKFYVKFCWNLCYGSLFYMNSETSADQLWSANSSLRSADLYYN
jgi:hypothetical protein